MPMQNKSAFTLIETIIAITLITVVMTAVTGLILTTLLANERNTHTLQATFLAQEGLEATRFMRDSNWLQNYTWDEGLDLWGDVFHVSESNPTITRSLVDKPCSSSSYCFGLSADEADGVVTLGSSMQFTRSLTFSLLRNEDGTPVEDAVLVTVNVTWLERGVDRSVELSTTLTDWK